MSCFSKECLFDALMILMEQKDFNKISISDLTCKAGISRTTFYRYYNNTEDIIFDYLIESAFDVCLPVPIEDIEFFDFKKIITQFFNFCLKNQRFLNNIVNANLSCILFNSMEYLCTKGAFKPYLKFIEYTDKYEISGFIGLWYKMTVDWIKDGMPEPEKNIDIGYEICMRTNIKNLNTNYF